MSASHHQRRPGTGRADERGGVLVEMALVSIFLLTLFAGTYDYGQAWRTGLAVNEAARTGARVGSAQGPVRQADYYALSGVKAALTSSGKIKDVTRVVVFKSTSADGSVPAACKTSSTTACQVITGAAFRTAWEKQPMATATTASGCLAIASSQNWCPTTRDNAQATSEWYGIWIQVRQNFEFVVFGSGTDVLRTAVMRIEPRVD
ncbi:MAG: pilus assembly protein [Acidimicrobiales bacterium]|nr:pilus assembly protein [Acidimicrobiales bacterium]